MKKSFLKKTLVEAQGTIKRLEARIEELELERSRLYGMVNHLLKQVKPAEPRVIPVDQDMRWPRRPLPYEYGGKTDTGYPPPQIGKIWC